MLKKINEFVNSGLAVAYIAVYTYFLSYFFKCGFYSFYKIPRSLIQIKINDFIDVGVIAVIIFLGVIAIFSFEKAFTSKSFIKLFLLFNIMFILIMIAIYVYIILIQNKYDTIDYMLAFFVFSIFLSLIGSLLFSTSIKISSIFPSKKKKEKKDNHNEEIVLSKKEKRIQEYKLIYSLLGIILIISSIYSYYIGKNSAKEKSEYLYFLSNEEIVALIEYENGYITVPYDNGTVKPIFSYVEISEASGIYVKSGKLTVDELIDNKK